MKMCEDCVHYNLCAGEEICHIHNKDVNTCSFFEPRSEYLITIGKLIELLNDVASDPHVKIFEKFENRDLLIYEGNPNTVSAYISEKPVTGFKVLDVGYLEIYTVS
jgi:hypothetical protein